MPRIALVTDSSCDLSPETLKRYDIRVLPLKIIYGSEVRLDRVDITPEEIYRRFPGEIPTTSMPSPGEARVLFEELRSEGYREVLCLHLSSGLSGTFNSVTLAARETEGMRIEVIDTLSLSLGLGLIVLRAAEWREAGMSLEELVERIRELVPRGRAFYVINTLEYLRKGGRIGLVEAALGGLLRIKPIISINEAGKYYTYAKERGPRQSLERLFRITADLTAKERAWIAVLQGRAEDEARALLERVRELPNVARTFLEQISPALVVHTGPGLVGVAVLPVN